VSGLETRGAWHFGDKELEDCSAVTDEASVYSCRARIEWVAADGTAEPAEAFLKPVCYCGTA
jgi:hypothetical protein